MMATTSTKRWPEISGMQLDGKHVSVFVIGFPKPKLKKKQEAHAYQISSEIWIRCRASVIGIERYERLDAKIALNLEQAGLMITPRP